MSTATDTKPNTSADEGKNTDGTATATGTQPANTEAKFSQADIDRIVKDRLDKERERIAKSQTEAQEKAEREAAEKKALEDGEFRKVIDAKETELSSLRPKAELAVELSTFVNETIDAEIKEWPDEVKTLVPDAADVQARAAEVKKLRPLAAKLSTAPPRPGNGRDPKPAGALSPAAELEHKKRELRQSGGYGRF